MKNVPLYSIIAATVFLTLAVILVIFADPHNIETITLIGFILSTIPSILASVFSEKSNKAITNGVVQEKARLGTTQALQETGVTAVASIAGDSTKLAMEALKQLLEVNTAAIQQNTNVHQTEKEGGASSGGPSV